MGSPYFRKRPYRTLGASSFRILQSTDPNLYNLKPFMDLVFRLSALGSRNWGLSLAGGLASEA